MAFTTLIMKNPHTGEIKKAPVGVSWTSGFFGPFVPLTRSHFSGAFLWLLFAMCSGGASVLVQLFIYNKRYLKRLIDNGYQVKYSPMSIEHVASKLNMSLPVIAKE
jgi:hypothetical protein